MGELEGSSKVGGGSGYVCQLIFMGIRFGLFFLDHQSELQVEF